LVAVEFQPDRACAGLQIETIDRIVDRYCDGAKSCSFGHN
jgi:hypothetical protein